MNLDHELRRALARTAAPAGFADRVVARATATPPQRGFAFRRLAAAVVLLAGIGGLTAHRAAVHRREEGERAREQVLVALHIASSKVRVAQHAVLHD